MLGLQQLLSKGRPASESDSDSDSTSTAQVAEQKLELEQEVVEQEVVEQGESDQGEEDEDQDVQSGPRQWCTDADVEPAFRPIAAFRSWRSWFIASYAELKQGMAKSAILYLAAQPLVSIQRLLLRSYIKKQNTSVPNWNKGMAKSAIL